MKSHPGHTYVFDARLQSAHLIILAPHCGHGKREEPLLTGDKVLLHEKQLSS